MLNSHPNAQRIEKPAELYHAVNLGSKDGVSPFIYFNG